MSEWEDFERAVAAFVKALTPGARVTHNAKLPDKHTGRLRQRDVWIEASIGPFPIKILVSCKRLKRKINEQDIDAFIGELSSSGAHKGVLYSLMGFTMPAVEKAQPRNFLLQTLSQRTGRATRVSFLDVLLLCGEFRCTTYFRSLE